MPNTFCKNVSGIAKYTILTFKLLKPVVVMPALGVVSMGVAICSCIMSRGFVMARRLPINQTGRSENMTYGNATTWANMYTKTCLRTPLSSQVNNGSAAVGGGGSVVGGWARGGKHCNCNSDGLLSKARLCNQTF